MRFKIAETEQMAFCELLKLDVLLKSVAQHISFEWSLHS